LSDRAKVNRFDTQPAPFTFRDSPASDVPASRNVDDLVRDRATQEVQRKAPPGTQSPPISSNPFVDSSPPISNRQNRAKPRPTTIDDPIIPPPDNIIWTPVDRRKPLTTPSSDLWPPRDQSSPPFPGQNTQPSNGRRYLPSDTKFPPGQIYTDKDPFAHLFAKDKTVPGTRPTSRTKPKTDTNQPGCKDPNSWSEKFKRFLEQAIDELGQELIQTMADRAGEVFEKAFAARDEAKRKNPDFDKGKPDLKKTLEDSIGKEFDKLSPQTKKDLKEYYDINGQKDGSYRLSRHKGRANDPTLPPIQIKDGIVIPELLAKSNRLSSGVDLGKEFAKGHGFNPTKSGVLKIAPNGKTLSQTAAVKDLIGPVQIHHKVTDALWQSHPLTQAMQAKIDAGSKSILGLNDSSNLIAAYKSPDAKAAYQKMLIEIGKTNPQLKTNIEGNLRRLESGKMMIFDLYHNGSHLGWDNQAKQALNEQVKILRKKFGTTDMNKIPEKDLNNAYRKAIMELGDKLYRTSEKLRQNQPLDEKDVKWVTPDYCSPKDKHKKAPGARISANPDKNTAWDRLMAATKHFNDLNQKSSNDQLPSALLNSQNPQAKSTDQKVRQGSTNNSIWAETMELANKLKASTEAQAAQKEDQQLVSQQQENTKQQKRGFEYGA
jgi:hypothetical protein